MRNRGVAVVTRNGAILLEKTYYEGRYFYALPGGGIEEGETPQETALRELKEECGLDGKIVKPLNVVYKRDGSIEYAFEIAVSQEQIVIVGKDPEFSEEEQMIKDVCWLQLHEISEKDRAFLWEYGLMEVEEFWDEVLSWGDEISYPKK
ncbi:MAG: NUDIX domain-containing protein [Lachnospiraceae bacterium]|nr:NUDIX hydrolase [Lachnospiraceae bacterium]MEE1258182.1 NUDIX domain-containing protein [Lachnospiraceae bacterium]